MNAPQGYYDENLRPYLWNVENLFQNSLHGEIRSYASCDTLQVKDYSRYDMGMFSEAAKKAHHDEQFPKDLEECYKLGAEMSKG